MRKFVKVLLLGTILMGSFVVRAAYNTDYVDERHGGKVYRFYRNGLVTDVTTLSREFPYDPQYIEKAVGYVSKFELGGITSAKAKVTVTRADGKQAFKVTSRDLLERFESIDSRGQQTNLLEASVNARTSNPNIVQDVVRQHRPGDVSGMSYRLTGGTEETGRNYVVTFEGQRVGQGNVTYKGDSGDFHGDSTLSRVNQASVNLQNAREQRPASPNLRVLDAQDGSTYGLSSEHDVYKQNDNGTWELKGSASYYGDGRLLGYMKNDGSQRLDLKSSVYRQNDMSGFASYSDIEKWNQKQTQYVQARSMYQDLVYDATSPVMEVDQQLINGTRLVAVNTETGEYTGVTEKGKTVTISSRNNTTVDGDGNLQSIDGKAVVPVGSPANVTVATLTPESVLTSAGFRYVENPSTGKVEIYKEDMYLGSYSVSKYGLQNDDGDLISVPSLETMASMKAALQKATDAPQKDGSTSQSASSPEVTITIEEDGTFVPDSGEHVTIPQTTHGTRLKDGTFVPDLPVEDTSSDTGGSSLSLRLDKTEERLRGIVGLEGEDIAVPTTDVPASTTGAATEAQKGLVQTARELLGDVKDLAGDGLSFAKSKLEEVVNVIENKLQKGELVDDSLIKRAQEAYNELKTTASVSLVGQQISQMGLTQENASTTLTEENVSVLGFDNIFGERSIWKANADLQPTFNKDGSIQFNQADQQGRLEAAYHISFGEDGKTITSDGSDLGNATVAAMKSAQTFQSDLNNLKDANLALAQAESEFAKAQKAFEKAPESAKAKAALDEAQTKLDTAQQAQKAAHSAVDQNVANFENMKTEAQKRLNASLDGLEDTDTFVPSALKASINDDIAAGNYEAAASKIDQAVEAGNLTPEQGKALKDQLATVQTADANQKAAEAEVQKSDNPQANLQEANGLDLVRMVLEILTVTEAEDDLSVQEEINIKSADVKDEIGEVEGTALATDLGEDASSASTVVGAASTVANLLSAATVDLSLLSEEVDVEVPEEETKIVPVSAGGTTAMGSQTGPSSGTPVTPKEESEPEPKDETDPISEAKRKEIERRREELMGQYVNAAIQVAEGMNAISNKFLDRAAILAAFSGSVQTEAAAFGLTQDVGRYVLLETLRGVALSSIQMGVQATRLLKEQTVEVSNDKGE